MSDRANTPPESAPLYFAGIDWHRRTAALHVLDRDRTCVLHTTVPADAGRVVLALEPFRPHVVVGVDSELSSRCAGSPDCGARRRC